MVAISAAAAAVGKKVLASVASKAAVKGGASAMQKSLYSGANKLIGAKTIKSMGGSMLRSGNKDVAKMGGSMLQSGKISEQTFMKLQKESSIHLKAIANNTRKSLNFLNKASPFLRQQTKILGKAWNLFWRPLGNLLGRILAPIGRVFLKLSVWLNKMFGGKGSGESDPVKRMSDLSLQRDVLFEMGDTEGALRLQAEIDDIADELAKLDITNLTDMFKSWKVLPNIGEILGKVQHALTSKGDKPNIEKAAELTRIYNEGQDLTIEDVENLELPELPDEETPNYGQKIWDDYIVPGFTSAKEWAEGIWDDYIDPGLKKAKLWGMNIFAQFLDPGFEVAKKWGTTIYDDYLKGAFESLASKIKSVELPNIGGGGDDKPNIVEKVWDAAKGVWKYIFGTKASGGAIHQTGPYLLHAGERVVPANSNSYGGTSSNFNVTNHITIQAKIDNSLDIHALARRLAELNESELRRRISYGGY